MVEAATCSCADVCAGKAHCACLFVYGVPEPRTNCTCICGNGAAAEWVRRPGDERAGRATLDAVVRLDVRAASLREIGMLLADVADAEIFVPADRIDERRELYLDNVSLDTVIRELGLMAVVRPDTGPA